VAECLGGGLRGRLHGAAFFAGAAFVAAAFVGAALVVAALADVAADRCGRRGRLGLRRRLRGSLGPGRLGKGCAALPAAVWAPFALADLPAAIRALAAFWAAAVPVVFVGLPPVWTCSPPRAALTLRVRRDLRRATAFL
jgi:hypothetical protein